MTSLEKPDEIQTVVKGPMYDCALLVLNFDGQELLAECLPSLVTAISVSKYECKAIVVDNKSTDDSVNFVRQNFPSVEVMQAKKNDFLFSLNKAVSGRSEDICVILNNDISVDREFLDPLLQYFTDDRVFAVTSKIFDCEDFQSKERKPAHICRLETKGSWYRDYYDESPDSPTYVQLASGAVSAYRRKMFIELGGFDPLYRPGYAEDLDLSYRAWQRGWHVILEPASKILHKGSVSMNRALGQKRRRIAERNKLLFLVKNCGDWVFVIKFILLYPKRFITFYMNGDKELAGAMSLAIPKLPLALWKRIKLMITGRRVLQEVVILSKIGKVVTRPAASFDHSSVLRKDIK
ncbi:glycosyltransferase family 2 protein [Pseudomonadota bacterium]